jgi:purine-binding chemotaxis protein CheW
VRKSHKPSRGRDYEKRNDKTFMSNETPQESLQHYFDDLLLESVAEPASAPAEPARPAQVVSPKVSAPKRAVTKPFAEPVAPSSDDKAKVAKLLQSARLKTVETTIQQTAEATVQDATETTIQEAAETTIQEAAEAPIEQAAEALVETPVVSPAETEVEVPVGARVEVAVEPDADVEAQDLGQVEEAQAYEWEANGRPAWAQERFEVLLFDVAGLTLAVPLIALGQIQTLTDELTPLFGQADWFMGLQPTPVGKIRTVNTAKFVMPERYCESFLESAKYVVSINGLPWGLAVDKVNQPITLDPEDVKWRGERSKRAWLAGTVKEHMCALIDIPMMGQMLQAEDANAVPARG